MKNSMNNKILLLGILSMSLTQISCTQKKETPIKMQTVGVSQNIVLRGDVPQQLGEHEIAFFNIMKRDYKLANGEITEGVAVALSAPDRKEWLTVGKGSTFELYGVVYEVLSVEYGKNHNAIINSGMSGSTGSTITLRELTK